MPKTTAERVQAFRQRQAALVSSLRADLADARRLLAAAETRRRNAEAARDAVLADCERLEAGLAGGPVSRCEVPGCRGSDDVVAVCRRHLADEYGSA